MKDPVYAQAHREHEKRMRCFVEGLKNAVEGSGLEMGDIYRKDGIQIGCTEIFMTGRVIPQRKTVEKYAAILNVPRTQLWKD